MQAWSVAAVLLAGAAAGAEPPRISVAEYRDRVYASWLGQCIGNIYGLPHENRYIAEPGPDTLPYGYKDEKRMREANGAFSDDDTDIEYMYLRGMEEFGPEPAYRQLARLWTYHIRDRIWVANRAALAAMHYGLAPPYTGMRQHNQHWFQIDPQLVNEIWAVTAPGMVRYAAGKSLWAARITNEGWGVEPTVHYGAMYAAAFFEKDVAKLIDIGTASLPPGSRFAAVVEDMKTLHRKYPGDWRAARKEMAARYFDGEPAETRTITNAILNGAAGILALLYGGGDFQRTLDLACAIGFDADNQAATMSGLLGVVHGTAGLPRRLLFPFPELNWKEPLNDSYKNVSRHDMPDASLKDIGARMAAQGEKIILLHGGKKVTAQGREYYVVNPEAEFVPPFEIAAGPLPRIEAGRPVSYRFLTGGAAARVSWRLAGKLPDGLRFRDGLLEGTARGTGVFPVTVAARAGGRSDELAVTLVARPANLAPAAAEALGPAGAAERLEKMRPGFPRVLYTGSFEALRDGKTSGPGSALIAGTAPAAYGYRWAAPQEIGLISFHTGGGEDPAWFQSLAVEYADAGGAWRRVDGVAASPALPAGAGSLDKAYGVEYLLAFPAVRTRAVRIRGDMAPAGGRARTVAIAELAVFGVLPDFGKLPRGPAPRP